ncbi:class II aldolase/adducin family protein [Actinocorallia sp. A-T 12471]|uniref:class II aldolase/adducin family protein n=1 Tax=Actinocorallia sp. A-T 12471 TaxID=3089813 RepID=UPI0029D1D0D5|nr:class II aldolase/adducin family protein [Actinocorallia sp. A-T 12471]MDX6740567.1 class II aldolase/adducin family protein [Actinocorallia sp. A-T 12471]
MTPAEEVAQGCRVLAANGNSDMIWGHLSLRDPNGSGIWLKEAGYGLNEITPDRVVHIDETGTPLTKPGKVHLEYPIHTEIMAARPDVNAVVHSHAESAVVFASTGLPLLPIGHEGTLFWPPDIPRFTRTGDLIHTPALGAEVAQTLSTRNALLLINHGLITVGPDIPTAVLTAIFLEKACRMQLQATSITPTPTHSPHPESLTKRTRCYPPTQLTPAYHHLTRTLPPPP